MFKSLFLKFYLNVSGLLKYVFKIASSYLPLPKELKAKKGCLNIQNKDEKCFLWSILASLHPVQCRNSQHRVSKIQWYGHELNKSGMEYPVDIKDIGKSEHQNNISINVHGYEDQKIFSLSITPRPLQDITWIYYISLLMKHLITYWWKIWTHWYWYNMIITTANTISVNIVCMVAPMKRY